MSPVQQRILRDAVPGLIVYKLTANIMEIIFRTAVFWKLWVSAKGTNSPKTRSCVQPLLTEIRLGPIAESKKASAWIPSGPKEDVSSYSA